MGNSGSGVRIALFNALLNNRAAEYNPVNLATGKEQGIDLFQQVPRRSSPNGSGQVLINMCMGVIDLLRHEVG